MKYHQKALKAEVGSSSVHVQDIFQEEYSAIQPDEYPKIDFEVSQTNVPQDDYYNDPPIQEALRRKTMIEEQEEYGFLQKPPYFREQKLQMKQSGSKPILYDLTAQFFQFYTCDSLRYDQQVISRHQNESNQQESVVVIGQSINGSEGAQRRQRDIRTAKKNANQYYASLIYDYFKEYYPNLSEQDKEKVTKLKERPNNVGFNEFLSQSGYISQGLSQFFQRSFLEPQILVSKVRTYIFKMEYIKIGHTMRKRFIDCQQKLLRKQQL